MELILGHGTSRYFWRSAYRLNRSPHGAVALPPGLACCHRWRDIAAAAPSWALGCGDKVCVLVSDASQARVTAKADVRAIGEHTPAKSFFLLGNGVYVTSPEFEFLSYAAELDVRQLVAFGDELCGLYSFDRNAERGFRTRKVPLTTKRRLADYVAAAKGRRGHRQAERALKYVVERSASPMETIIETLACLPLALGGYALPMPHMNEKVPLSASAARIARRSFCVADMCFPGVSLDVEYHGRYDHDSSAAFDSDRARVNALIEMGYEVIELTYAQVADMQRFEEIVKHIARRVGKRLRAEALGPLPARVEARQLLFAWNQSFGEPQMRPPTS